MYLRHTSRHKDGKHHVYWQLVRSVRRNGKVVQETVAQLGELDAEGRAGPRIGRRSPGARSNAIFSKSAVGAPDVAVRLDQLRVERDRASVMSGWGWHCGRRSSSTRCAARCCRRAAGAAWSLVAAIW